MDIIQKAIDMKQHISKRKELNLHVWEGFYEQEKEKKVFLFGVSICADYFFKNCKEVQLEGVVDNNTHKHGLRVDELLGEAMENPNGYKRVLPVNALMGYPSDEIIVLIASTNYYEEMAEQLEKMGIKKYYVLLIMEANRRKTISGSTYSVNNEQEYKDYIHRCCQEKIDNSKIVVYAFGYYSDHGKYITEALLRIRKDLDIVWLLNDIHAEVVEGVRKVYTGNRKRCIYELETAKMWIYNMPITEYIIKRPEQIYIQTKHWSSVTLKKFYLDSQMLQNIPEKVENWKYNSQIMDYIITGSNFDTISCRRGFNFYKEVCQVGSPRSDALFHGKEFKEKIYKYYKIEAEAYLLVYAPTYRFGNLSIAHEHISRDVDLDFELVKATLEKRFGGKWYIILRLHPSVANEGMKMVKDRFIIDASHYEDGEELAAACDIMISDYSSIMFEPAFVKKPVFLFATDRKSYIDKEYDLLIDYDTLPFPIAESNEELIKNIEKFEQNEYEQEIDKFMNKYGVNEDGHASERAAQFISRLVPQNEP